MIFGSTWDSAPSGKTVDDINTNAIRSYMKRANESGRLEYKFTNRDDILKYNPGTFPDGLTPQDFIDEGGRSIRRNPLLA